MSEPSPETLSAAVQALYRVRAVEGPPGDDGQRAVWHLCADGAELLSFVDAQGRVQRQELTLLDEHCVWTSGGGLRTGLIERGQGPRVQADAAVVRADPDVVPARLLRAARALSTYEGEDRYLLHMKRVLALAREGIEMSGNNTIVPASSAPTRPMPTVDVQPAPVAPFAPAEPPVSAPPPLPQRASEGVVMLVVLGVALVVSLFLLVWFMR
ncbi:hypothetical protein P2318_03465 [Myxococcaceae bacterium GXIMD 01537]